MRGENMTKTRDIDIRTTLRDQLKETFGNDSSTIIIDELQVCIGDARVDVAVVNGSIYGYEIKSESDTLDRLPQQVEYYNRVFDYVTLVCSTCFLDKLDLIVPAWWGIQIAKKNEEGLIDITSLRPSLVNETVDPYAIAQLLWRNEAIDILAERGLDKGVRSKPKREVWKRISASLELEELKECVRTTLKNRVGWRSDSLRRLCDD